LYRARCDQQNFPKEAEEESPATKKDHQAVSDDWASIAMPENVEDTVAEWFEVGDVSVGVGLLRDDLALNCVTFKYEEFVTVRSHSDA